jgi:hypothetical protein
MKDYTKMERSYSTWEPIWLLPPEEMVRLIENIVACLSSCSNKNQEKDDRSIYHNRTGKWRSDCIRPEINKRKDDGIRYLAQVTSQIFLMVCIHQ